MRNLLLASVLLAGTAGAALAAPATGTSTGPRLVGGLGDSAEVIYDGAPMGSLVGGGTVMLSGGDTDRVFTYGRVNAQPGRFATITGGGDNQQVIELPAPRG